MSTASSLSAEPIAFAMPALAPPPVADELTKPTVLAINQMGKAEAFRLAGGTAAAFTHRSPTKATPNEDVAALVPVGPKQGVLIVADGLGGHANGEEASQLAVKKIVDTIRRAGADLAGDQLRPTILNGIESANAAVRDLGTGSASTLAIAEIDHGVMRSYHVGDSVILLTGGRGRIKLQTIWRGDCRMLKQRTNGHLDLESAAHA